jgi:CHAT domain-containing protein
MLLSFLLCGSETAQQKSAADAGAVLQQIQRLRHTNGEVAREKAKKAFGEAKSAGYPEATEQRFRLLYADILIEQNLFSGVDSLLAFEPRDAEIAARLLAAIAYWEEKAQGREVIAARTFAKAIATAQAVQDPCWKSEVLVHYAQLLVVERERGADTPLAQAAAETNYCPDKFWAAYRFLVEGNLYATNHRYEQELTSSLAASDLSGSHNFAQLIPLTNGNLALAYFHLGDFDHALSLLRRAESWYPNETLDLAIDIGHRARVHHWQEEDVAAANDYKQALDILKRLHKEDSPWSLRFLDELTTVLIDMGQLEKASYYNQSALNAFGRKTERWTAFTVRLNLASMLRIRGQWQPALDQLRALKNSLSHAENLGPDAIWRLHSELAQTLVAMGRKEPAEREFKTAIRTAYQVRDGLGTDWNRMTFSAYVGKLVAPYIDFEVSQGRQLEALQVAENFRAQRLAERLHLSKPPVAEQFQTLARALHSVILSYWITKKHSYVWVTTPHESKVFPLQGLDTLAGDIVKQNLDIDNQRDLLSAPALPVKLYTKLVMPLEQMIPSGGNLIIVPDGPLASLNFETLIPPARPARFWLNSVTVTIAPSLAVLHEAQTSHPTPEQFLLIGGTSPAEGLRPLPGSEREIDDIQKLFPLVHTLPLRGANATPQRFLDSKPGEFSLLHISAHAFANKESPLDSYIALTRDTTHPDGRLYAHDLMDLKLTSELVTLSVCEGAGGKNLPGEGLIGLTWAILSSGARNVVAGLWKVSDPATADFMRNFYTHLSAHENPATALHDTKLAMAVKHSPYSWAAFQLYRR